MDIKTVALEFPEGANIIFGQSHFIKTVEDLYEIVVSTVPDVKFGLAFCEASGACLVRIEGNDDMLREVAAQNALSVGCGHTFLIVMEKAYPINVLNAIKGCQEVCRVFCATANAVTVLVAETEQGRGVLGVIDGNSPRGIEGPADVTWRKELLQKIGYKR